MKPLVNKIYPFHAGVKRGQIVWYEAESKEIWVAGGGRPALWREETSSESWSPNLSVTDPWEVHGKGLQAAGESSKLHTKVAPPCIF